MTNRHSNSVLEQEMIDCLRRQKAYYDQATLIADEITNTMQSGVADESALTKLKAILEEVAGWETRTQGMRQRWRDAGKTPSDELSQLLKTIEGQLLHMMETIAMAEGTALEAKGRLQPQMSEAARRRKMQAAYGQQQG